MRRRASLVLNLTFFVFILTAGAVVAAPMIPVMLGYRTMVVVSGSMEPEIGVGDAVVIDRQAPRDVRVGDVITFQPFGAQELKTHRVLAISRIDDHIYFHTKGDANDTPDPDLADSRAVVGTVRMHVPEVGRFLLYSSLPRVRLVLIGLPALLLMFQQGAALVRGRRRDPETARPPLAAHPRRGPRAQAVTSSWLLVLVIAVAIARGAGVATAPEPAWALSTDSIAVGDNTFTTASQFGPGHLPIAAEDRRRPPADRTRSAQGCAAAATHLPGGRSAIHNRPAGHEGCAPVARYPSRTRPPREGEEHGPGRQASDDPEQRGTPR